MDKPKKEKKDKKPLEKLYYQDKIKIISSIPELKFSPDEQINEDSIDLRLHPRIKKLKPKVASLDVKEPNIEENFEDFLIPKGGYDLQPGELLFCQTLEIIMINSTKRIGLIVGRPTIASYGISVNLDQIKVPVKLAWNFPLHIKNNANVPVRIYAFMKIAQLLFVAYPYGRPYKKEGNLRKNQPANIAPDERNIIFRDYEKWETEIPNGNFAEYKFDEKKIRDEIEKNSKQSILRKVLSKIFRYDNIISAIKLILIAGIIPIFLSPIHIYIKVGCLALLIILLIYEYFQKTNE